MTQRQEKAKIDGTWQNAQTEEFMNNETNALGQVPQASGKHPYRKPVLSELGDLRTVTLSPTPDDFEESGPGSFRREFQNEVTSDQFEGRSSRNTDSGGGGRSGRGE